MGLAMHSRPPLAAHSHQWSSRVQRNHRPACWTPAIQRAGPSADSSMRDKQCCEVQQHSAKLGTPSVWAQGSAAAPASAADIPFFNREQELQRLNVMCSRRPRSITVLLGPRSTGKSALLKQYMRIRDLAGTKCYIDARSVSVSTPDALGRALLELSLPKVARQVQGLFPAAKNIAQTVGKALEAFSDKQRVGNSEVTTSGKAISAVLAALAGEKEAEPPLSAVIHAYRAVLDAWDEARAQGQLDDSSPPLLVLDEANVLMGWSEQHMTDMRELLRFFVSISKADNRSHVVMATSEYAFQTWLSKEIGPGFFDTFVIGDLDSTHAREYLNQHLQLLHKAEVSDEEWLHVYQVCGGNAGALSRVAGFYSDFGTWEPALIQVLKDVATALQPGYSPPPTAGYTAADFATAVKAILDSPYKAVDRDLLSSQLGSLEPLQAMVKANLLALRPFSPWAYDLSAEAFGPERLATVITAPGALHLHLMEVQRGKLLEALDAKEATTPVPQRPGSPSSLELQEVRQQIKEVEREIKEVAAKLEAAEEAGNEGKAARLGRKEELLRQKEQSLREEVLLLLKAG